jgi:hypothetical protein
MNDGEASGAGNSGYAIEDLFEPVVLLDRMHPGFRMVLQASGYEPSRVMMQQVFQRMGDRGGNFRQQLQTEGFDARVWELYLYAAFSEAGYTIDTEQAVPDFSLEG